jgi:hypothetical protein
VIFTEPESIFSGSFLGRWKTLQYGHDLSANVRHCWFVLKAIRSSRRTENPIDSMANHEFLNSWRNQAPNDAWRNVVGAIAISTTASRGIVIAVNCSPAIIQIIHTHDPAFSTNGPELKSNGSWLIVCVRPICILREACTTQAGREMESYS